MTDRDHSHANSRDCGSFFLDAVGHYAPDDITTHWSDQPRPTTPEAERVIARTWEEQTAVARETGRRLFDGPLCRLIDYEAGPKLSLLLGPVGYREFVGTNMYNAAMRYSQGAEVLANPLGVSAALVTADGFIVLARRSRSVAFHAEMIHPLGGMVSPSGSDTNPPCPVTSLRNELMEELSLDSSRIAGMLCVGMVRDKQIVQPELIFDVLVDADMHILHQGHQRAEDRCEHTELIPVRDRPTSVVDFVRATEALTPVALAALLLHGLRTWGSGWFAAARGYLRKVL